MRGMCCCLKVEFCRLEFEINLSFGFCTICDESQLAWIHQPDSVNEMWCRSNTTIARNKNHRTECCVSHYHRHSHLYRQRRRRRCRCRYCRHNHYLVASYFNSVWSHERLLFHKSILSFLWATKGWYNDNTKNYFYKLFCVFFQTAYGWVANKRGLKCLENVKMKTSARRVRRTMWKSRRRQRGTNKQTHTPTFSFCKFFMNVGVRRVSVCACVSVLLDVKLSSIYSSESIVGWLLHYWENVMQFTWL